MSNGQNDAVAKLMAEIEALKKQNAALVEAKAKAESEGTFMKVSEKGAVSLYGLGRFPVTLYGSQWETVFTLKPQIEAFIAANKSKLKTKEQAQAEKAAEKLANDKLAQAARASDFKVEIVNGKPTVVKAG